jgi:hypothetical protein
MWSLNIITFPIERHHMAIGAIFQPKAANEPVANTPTPAEVVTPQPANEGQVPEGANNAPSQSDDLISRVTQFEVEQNPVNKTPEQVDAELFNDKEFRAEIDRTKATNPELAKHMELLRKSAMTGVNNKFQQIAEIRKELEAVKNNASHYKFKANSVDDLLNNPEFINAAKEKLGSSKSPIADDPVMSDETKQYIQGLEKQLKDVQEGLTQRQSAEANQEWTKHHEVLSTKYKNYDRSRIDEIAKGLIEGRVKATPEYLYKATYHDENVRKAYEFGRKEGAKLLSEKKEVNQTINGVNAVKLDTIAQDKEESNLSFMQKIIANKLAGTK